MTGLARCGYQQVVDDAPCPQPAGHPGPHRVRSPYGDGRWRDIGPDGVEVARGGGWGPEPLLPSTVTVPRPHVPFGPKGKPPNDADVDYLRSAAGNIEFSRCLGSNLTATVVKLLNDVADAIAEGP